MFPVETETMTTEQISITSRTVTDDQIRALRSEAGAHGDLDLVRTCDRALARRGGRGTVARILEAERAEAADYYRDLHASESWGGR